MSRGYQRSAARLQSAGAILRAAWLGYAVALAVPLTAALSGSRAGMPPFVFDHLAVLFVVGVAVIWGMGPAVTAALSAAVGNNFIVHVEPARALSEFPDVLDLIMFVVVAATVGWLVASARRERARAESAAARERHAREERDRLVSMVTHDLATPLGVIRGSLQFARRAGPQRTVDVDRLFARLDVAASRATSLIKTLADARTLDAGTLSLELRRTDLRDLVRPVVEMMDQSSERHPVALAVPSEPVIVECDPERLQRVLENLVSNAVKYSPEGGAVEVTLATERQQAVITVRDYGIGISADALPHVFDRGFRADEAVAAAPGLGLGLTIAAEIVRRHRGTIEADGARPGSIFRVRLPLSKQTAGTIPFDTRRVANDN